MSSADILIQTLERQIKELQAEVEKLRMEVAKEKNLSTYWFTVATEGETAAKEKSIPNAPV